MSKLQQLYDDHGQSPWLDDLTRHYLTGGGLRRLVDQGIRGVTSNPTIFQRAIAGSTDYDDQLRILAPDHGSEDSYWSMVVEDIQSALTVLRPVHDRSGGEDGVVSVELAPGLAHDTASSVAAARALHQRIAAPNLFVKIPATAEGVPAVRQMVSEVVHITAVRHSPYAGRIRTGVAWDLLIHDVDGCLRLIADEPDNRGLAAEFIDRTWMVPTVPEMTASLQAFAEALGGEERMDLAAACLMIDS